MIYDYEYGEMYEPVREPFEGERTEERDEEGNRKKYYFEDGQWWEE